MRHVEDFIDDPTSDDYAAKWFGMGSGTRRRRSDGVYRHVALRRKPDSVGGARHAR